MLSPRPTQAKPVPKIVLVVDDDEALRTLARTILHRQGYKVLVASDGKAALELAKRHVGVIDLLVVDVVMPGMSGPQLAEQIRAIRPEIRVLFMSGLVGGATIRNYPHAIFLSKPFDEELLSSKVQEALKGRLPPDAW
jgi:CheY-like chemotaxis protein